MAMALLVGAFCVGGVVACGGDDDAPIVPVETQTAPTDQLDQDAFIDEADSICEEANVAIASLADTSAGDPSTQISQEREIVEGVIDQIDTLGAPSEDESTLDDFIDAFEELADNLGKQELAAERDDATALADAQTEEASIQAEIASAAEDYGFRECGQEGDVTTDTGTDATGGDTGVAPVEPAPAEPAPAPAPAEPAPAPAPAPAPPSGGTGGDTGGTPPGGGSGGVSP
jgi:peptidoglycan DL-endopeptidase CwlO